VKREESARASACQSRPFARRQTRLPARRGVAEPLVECRTALCTRPAVYAGGGETQSRDPSRRRSSPVHLPRASGERLSNL